MLKRDNEVDSVGSKTQKKNKKDPKKNKKNVLLEETIQIERTFQKKRCEKHLPRN